MKLLRLLPLAFAVAACGTDAATAPPTPPSGAGGQPRYDSVQTVAVSAGEHDRFVTAPFDAGNRLYAAGFVGAGADQMMAVTRFTADGAVDAGFGAAGTATVNVAQGGKTVELARGVVVQGDGQVVVAGPASETEVAVSRFDTAGRLDQTLGYQGIVRLDLSSLCGLY